MRQGLLMIGGNKVAAQSGETFAVFNPDTQQVFAHVARAGVNDVEQAVASAQKGFKQWSALAPKEREQVLLKAAELIEAQGMERLLDILIDESGSAITKATFEINYTVDLLRTAAGEVRRLYGETFPNDNPNRMSMVMRNPIGVVAVVSPYNAPLSLLTKMAAFPLAAGNAIVIKPSEETPIIALELADILWQAGIPKDAVNVVCGFGEDCGAPLTNHKDVDCIALTGSSQTGIAVGQAAIKRMVRAQLELGGKSAALVLKDMDPVKAAQIVAQGIFTHAGQICMANSRVVVAKEIFEQFCRALKAAAESLIIGELRSPACIYGPLINQKAVDKVDTLVRQAVSEGASLLTGGKVKRGLVYEPTVLVNPSRESGAWREELFGPVACVVSCDDIDQGIELANDSDYGLSASVLTKNIAWAMRAAKEIDAGAVHVGMHSFQSNALAPIGGSKLSGIGRSGGAYSTEEFTELKWISIELSDD
ncbi:aldehyde dehydrogenase [Paraferrimonas sp. SM1919]|uniref:aldehyde dehydrogenase family protein n=1 Tax=Paraferrimonas sp. SM1919 TaxID=2662263 RepID=UPI0013D64B8E|nr:aldehyde dehydrogenase family protein [Paraferrimonas sp. SM1919]